MSKKLIKIFTAVFSLSAIFGVFNFVLAATPDVGLQFGEAIGLSSADPRIIAAKIIQILLGFLGIIAVGLIVYAGFLWMTAAGNEEKIDTAKKTLVSAIIGLVIILSAFAIATFILSNLLAAIGNGGNGNDNGDGPGSAIGGAGVIGSCSVENVYPASGQKDVSRNSVIIITFKEPVNPKTICKDVDASGDKAGQCNGSLIVSDNVLIYKSDSDSSVSANLITDVQVFSTADQKTFTLKPSAYLGSPSEYIWYTAHFGQGIQRADSLTSIFDSCTPRDFLEWSFEVSNKIDLTPPYVVSGGVFPPPDSEQDAIVKTEAVQSVGSITVKSQPQVYKEASLVSVKKNNAATSDKVIVDPSSTLDGSLSVNAKDAVNATLDGNVPLGASILADQKFNFPGYLNLTVNSPVETGNLWTIVVKPAVQPNTLTVGSMVYTFVDKTGTPNQIVSDSDNNKTAINIAAALNRLSSEIIAVADNNVVNITAKNSGKAGNNMVIRASEKSPLTISDMSGGVDGSATVATDVPRNSVIQINFNESVFPNNVVGDASLAINAIHVLNAEASLKNGADCSADKQCQSYKCETGKCKGDFLAGKFTIANQYKTLEFISNIECGVNGCGQKIYCLPEKSNLRVEIAAASLSAACTSNDNCLATTPFNTCGQDKICSNADDGNFPQSSVSSQDGVMDLSLNSLDGNRDKQAKGPFNFYNENTPVSGTGDSFYWSFFVSDKLDITAPKIISTLPAKETAVKDLTVDLEVVFDKIMMASSLKTGSTISNNGKTDVTHKNINIWNLAGKPVGYWIEGELRLVNGSPDHTDIFIKHGDFGGSLSYRAQLGSGVNDIFQNCFKPSKGPACQGITEDSPSCCKDGATKDLGKDGNCISN